jgi:preprotein translocase SecF subunit
MRAIFKNPNYDFLARKNIFITLSALIIIGCFAIWFIRGDSKYGVDFSGGYKIVAEISNIDPSNQANLVKLEEVLLKNGVSVGEVSVENAEKNFFAITIPPDSTTESGQKVAVVTKLKEALQSADIKLVNILSSDYVGPTVGKELRRKGLIAVILGLAGVMIYVATRFEFAFGFGAVIALFHDVIFATGVYLALGYKINMESLAAALTIVGYSVNDTLVIFDRVREELFKKDHGTLSSVVNRSINAMLGRTIITHVMTTFSVLALLVFGGGAIRDMSVFLLAGLISGSYSTMYIASPVMMWWHKLRGGTEDV